MKKLMALLCALLCLGLCGCALSAAQPKQDKSDTVTYSKEEGGKQQEEPQQDTQTPQTEPARPEHENTGDAGAALGQSVQNSGESVAPDASGYWEVREGLPQGLAGYGVLINENGSAVQYALPDGAAIAEPVYLHCLRSGDTYTLADDNNTAVLTLVYKDGVMTCDNLGPQQAVFESVGHLNFNTGR